MSRAGVARPAHAAIPQGFVAGTTMPFAGMSSERDLADVVSYRKSPSP